MADNLPNPEKVAKLVQSLGVKHIKIFDYDKEVLKAFEKTDISVIICIPNGEINGLAVSEKAARTWVHNNVNKRLPATKITYIVVGNEVSLSVPIQNVSCQNELCELGESFNTGEGFRYMSCVEIKGQSNEKKGEDFRVFWSTSIGATFFMVTASVNVYSLHT